MSSADLRDQFLFWQCRLRQIAVRSDGGRPSTGMAPKVFLSDGREVSVGMTVLLIPDEPVDSTTFFRFQVQRSNDPREIYEKGLQYLQATYFHEATGFSDQMTALFNAESSLAATLVEAGKCLLEFSQYGQEFRMLCAVERLRFDEERFQATLWHNRLFNPGLPDGVKVLTFTPDWDSAEGLSSSEDPSCS